MLCYKYENRNYMLNYNESPPMGLRLDVAGALLTKRIPRFLLYDDIQWAAHLRIIYDRQNERGNLFESFRGIWFLWGW